METFDKFWNYTLFTVGGGAQINVSQVITTVLFILIALLLGRYLMRLLAGLASAVLHHRHDGNEYRRAAGQ